VELPPAQQALVDDADHPRPAAAGVLVVLSGTGMAPFIYTLF
jgi:hypothetical protein